MVKIHSYKQKLNETGTVGHHSRVTYWLYPKDENKDALAVVSLEFIAKKPELSFSTRFHVGNKGSETPWDGHLVILGTGVYWSFTRGRRLAHLITSARDSRKLGKQVHQTRNLGLRLSHGNLSWDLWTRSESYGYPLKRKTKGKKFRSWARRDGSISVNPIEWFFGPIRYSYEDMDRHIGKLNMVEDEYPVILTLQKVLVGRTKSKKKKLVGYSIDVDAPKGIPTHYDHSGGWKGDRSYGFGVDMPADRAVAGLTTGEWPIDAFMLVEAYVLQHRARSGFREPQKLEEAG